MIITTQYTNVQVDGEMMRTLVIKPQAEGKYPGIICYSDIFQLTETMVRACARLAGYGFVVAAPEIYHRIEPPATVIAFDDGGRTRGMDAAARTQVSEFDADCRAVLNFLTAHPNVADEHLGAMGFCIGGHLAFRAAFQTDVKATICFYGTGIHNGKLGSDADAESLSRAGEIQGELLMIWGGLDPHVPADGRAVIETALHAQNVNFSQRIYPAEHAFMRDVGARFDPEATDLAFSEMIHFYRRIFV